MKSLKFIFLAIFTLLLIGSASAMSSYGAWMDGTASTFAFHGDELEFYADFLSMNYPMTISVKLYDNNYDLIETYENNKVVNTREYFKQYTLDTSTGIITNATTTTFDDVNVTYVITTESNEEFSVDAMSDNFSEGVDEVSKKVPTVLLIAAIILILGVLALLIGVWNRMRLGGGSEL